MRGVQARIFFPQKMSRKVTRKRPEGPEATAARPARRAAAQIPTSKTSILRQLTATNPQEVESPSASGKDTCRGREQTTQSSSLVAGHCFLDFGFADRAGYERS